MRTGANHYDAVVIEALGHFGPELAIEPLYFTASLRALAARRAGLEARAGAAASTPPSITFAASGVAQVDIVGPLARRGIEFLGITWLDGYDLIEDRVGAALKAAEVRDVLVRIDSPGGAAAGLFEATRRMSAMVKASGKRVMVYADELASSAGYALAVSLATHGIFLPPEGMVGSIGTMATHYDISRALEVAGIKVTHVVDPEGKAAGTPTLALSEQARKDWQARVSEISNTFYQLVGERRGMKPDAVRALDARLFSGQRAVQAGLANEVLSFPDVVRRAGAGSALGAKSLPRAESEPLTPPSLPYTPAPPTEAEVQAYQKKYGIKNEGLARAVLTQERRAATPPPPTLVAPSPGEPTEAEVQAYQKKYGIKNEGLARHALKRTQQTQVGT